MKNILVVCLLCVGSLNSFSQENLAGPCPIGTHLVISYEADGFAFHRPRFQCLSGFWFCFKNGQWVVSCKPDGYMTNRLKEEQIDIERGKVTVLGELLKNESVLFNFPLRLLKAEGFTEKDLSIFNVDEALEFDFYKTRVRLKTGNYPVNISKEGISVDVKCELVSNKR